MLRQDLNNKSFAISQAAVVKKESGQFFLKDGFIVGGPVESSGWTGSLIGSLVGVLAGPLDVLLGGSVGWLIGYSMDMDELEDNCEMLAKACECLVDGNSPVTDSGCSKPGLFQLHAQSSRPLFQPVTLLKGKVRWISTE